MKKQKFLGKAGYAGVLALALVMGLFTFTVNKSSDFSRLLKTAVDGYSGPVNTTGSTFGCNPDSYSWSDSVWCQTYGSTYDGHVTEANRHASTIVMFKRNLPYYGDFYVVGSYGSTAVGKNGQTYHAGAIVECPAQASIQYHSSSHHKYSPNLGEGFYDGNSHYWCDQGGTSVDPVVKTQLNGLDYAMTDRDKLFKFEFPDAAVKYKSYKDSSNSSSSGFVKCPAGATVVGPYTTGNQYTNQYWVKEAGKRDYYRCYDTVKGTFVNAEADSASLASPYDSISNSYFRIDSVKSCDATYSFCQPSCANGDASCGGAGTVGPITQACASNTYWCQTTSKDYRYCSADPTCTTAEMTPPGPTWGLGDPTQVELSDVFNNYKTTFGSGDTIEFKSNVNLTGTGWPGTVWVHSDIKVSTTPGNFSSPIWTGSIDSPVNASGLSQGVDYFGTGELVPGGPYYFCIQSSAWSDGRMTAVNDSVRDFSTACVASLDTFTISQPVAFSCNNNGVCDGGETVDNCAADCSTATPSACNNNGVCDGGEILSNCAADCSTATPSACNNNGVCEYGESSGSCPSDCSAAPTDSTSCKLGQTDCDPNLNCENGMRCYVGGKLSCIDWNETCSGSVCPPAGTRDSEGCNPPGSVTVGVDNNGDGIVDDFPGYCEQSMQCYSADKKKRYCQPASPDGGYGTMGCTNPDYPKSCSPWDSSCYNEGERGTSGYCAPGTKECHDNQGFLCVREGQACPAGSGVCPTDPGGPSSKGCTLDNLEGPRMEDGGYCGSRNSFMVFKQSPSGGIFCMPNPNPGDPTGWETIQPPAGYGRCNWRDGKKEPGCIDQLNVSFPKQPGQWLYCAVGMRKENPDGTVMCVTTKDYRDNPPSVVDEPDLPLVCSQVITMGYNPSTTQCKTFADSCLPEGWQRLGSNQACENGKVIELSGVKDERSLRDFIEKKITFVDSVRYGLKDLPPTLSDVSALKDLVEKARQQLKDLQSKFPAKSARELGAISEELERINRNTISLIEEKWGKLKVHTELASLKKQIQYRLSELKYEADTCAQDSEYCVKLNDGIAVVESLLAASASASQTGQVLQQLVQDIKLEWEGLIRLIKGQREERRDKFFDDQVKKLFDSRERIGAFIKDHDVRDKKILQAYGLFEGLLNVLSDMLTDLDFNAGRIFDEKMPVGDYKFTSPKQILEQAFDLKMRIETYLKAYNYQSETLLTLDDVLPFVEEEVRREIQAILPDMARTVKVLLDEALQELTITMVEVVKDMEPAIKQAVSQSIENLAIEVNETRRKILDQVVAAKNEIMAGIKDLEILIEERSGRFTANQYRSDVMEVAAPVIWCGEYAELVESKINTAGLALENGENVDLNELRDFVAEAKQDNVLECRNVGASRFYMPMEAWYWPYVEESADRGCIKGYSEPDGSATGYFGEANPTLRIEALKMVSCIFGVPMGSGVTDRSDVPAWGAPYFNGLVAAGVEFDWNLPMDQNINRFEIAELVARTMFVLDREGIVGRASEADLVKDFTDASEVVANKYAMAVETLVDLGVLNGHADGHFGGYGYALRSEFAAILDRVNDLIVETYGVGGTAIGNPDGN